MNHRSLAAHMLDVAALFADGGATHLARSKAYGFHSPTVRAKPKARSRQDSPYRKRTRTPREALTGISSRLRSCLCEPITSAKCLQPSLLVLVRQQVSLTLQDQEIEVHHRVPRVDSDAPRP